MELTGWRAGGAAVPHWPGLLRPRRPQELRAPLVTTSEGDPVAKGVAEEGLFREEGNG